LQWTNYLCNSNICTNRVSSDIYLNQLLKTFNQSWYCTIPTRIKNPFTISFKLQFQQTNNNFELFCIFLASQLYHQPIHPYVWTNFQSTVSEIPIFVTIFHLLESICILFILYLYSYSVYMIFILYLQYILFVFYLYSVYMKLIYIYIYIYLYIFWLYYIYCIYSIYIYIIFMFYLYIFVYSICILFIFYFYLYY